MTNNFVFEADMAAKKIHVVREFNAPVEKVWRAFTEPGLIEKWMAPKPWTLETTILDLTVGGLWIYAMVSPEGQKHWTRIEFTAIEKGSVISSINMFSDEDGNTAPGASRSLIETKFSSIGINKTQVEVVKTFTSEDTVKMFVERGFKEGTTMTYNQLDELLALE